MDHGRGLSPRTIDGLKAFFVSLAGITVTLRLVANWKYSKRLLIDDCMFFLPAWCFLLRVSGTDFVTRYLDIGHTFLDSCLSPQRLGWQW
jgi:hypothetical protein